MFEIDNRRALVAIALAVTLLLAGCSGGGDTTPTVESTDGPTATDAGNGTADGESEASLPSTNYQWTEGESYSYESATGFGSNSQYNWTVTDVSDGEVTVEIENRVGNNVSTQTVTGPQGNFFDGSAEGETFAFVILHLPQILVDGQDLSPGNSWTVSSDEFDSGSSVGGSQAIDVSVTGTADVAGQQCYAFEATDGSSTFEGCTRADWPFALQMNASSSGDAQFAFSETTVTDFTRP